LCFVFVFIFLRCLKSKRLMMKEFFEEPQKKGKKGLCDTHSHSPTNSTTPEIRGLCSGISLSSYSEVMSITCVTCNRNKNCLHTRQYSPNLPIR
jgi:hypothetical protein